MADLAAGRRAAFSLQENNSKINIALREVSNSPWAFVNPTILHVSTALPASNWGSLFVQHVKDVCDFTAWKIEIISVWSWTGQNNLL